MKHIVTLGTVSNGGINSVINGYIDNGLFDGYRHTRISTHCGRSKFIDLCMFIAAIFRLAYILIESKNVILHCHMSYKGSFWRKLTFTIMAKCFRSKTIIHLHGSEFKVYFESRSKFVKNILIWLIKSVDEFVVLSELWADYIYAISGRKVSVINNYVDISAIDLKRKKGSVLFLGAFIQRKGIYDLLHAFKGLDKHFSLELCGSGEDEKVHKLVEKLGLGERVKFHGWVNFEQKRRLLSECEVLILPSYNEGLPMVIIEAMACNIPVVSTSVGGIPEVIQHGKTGYLVEPGNTTNICEQLNELAKCDYSSITKAASEYYRNHFTSEIVLPKWRRLYESL